MSPRRAAHADPAPAPSPYFKLDEKHATLKQVHVLFRHGARAPLTDKRNLWKGSQWDVCGCAYQAAALDVKTVDGEPRPPNSHDAQQLTRVLEGGCHMGQLTLAGQTQAYDLGQWLRQRYIHQLSLLPDTFTASLVDCQSTNFQRTLATLAGVLTGLYPALVAAEATQASPAGAAAGASADAAGAGGGAAVSVSVGVRSEADEVLYADTASCPHLLTFFKQAHVISDAAVAMDPEVVWATGRIKEVMGEQMGPDYFAGKWRWADFLDVFSALKVHGKALPAGVDDRLLLAIERLATAEFTAYVAPALYDEHSHSVLRLSMGRFITSLGSNMQQAAAAAAAPPPTSAAGGASAPAAAALPRLHLRSGHDSTIMPMLVMMGVPLDRWPTYCSSLAFELWEVGATPLQGDAGAAPPGTHLVKVMYQQQELPMPFCPPGTLPTLATFMSRVVDRYSITADEHRAACYVADDPVGPAVSLASPMETEEKA